MRDGDGRVVVIDFGLAHNSIIPEDKGVDLYVLVRGEGEKKGIRREGKGKRERERETRVRFAFSLRKPRRYFLHFVFVPALFSLFFFCVFSPPCLWPRCSSLSSPLYAKERAITVTHAATKLFEHVMSAYKTSSKQWSASFNKFAEVRLRGRKRSMIG